MMFVADLGRAGLTALIPLSVALGGPTMAVILLVAAPMAILRSFFLAGYTASVPALVGRSQVGRANSYLRGHLLDGLHPRSGHRRRPGDDDRPRPDAWRSTPLSFALSALGLIFVRRELRAPVDRPRQPLLTEIREGIDFIVRNPTLRTAILFWGAISILLAPLVTALAVHVTRDLGDPPSVLGLLLASYGVGTVLGSRAHGSLDRARPGRRDAPRWQLRDGHRTHRPRGHGRAPGPGRRRVRRRDRPVGGARHVPHAAHRAFARRAARTRREHGADDLARTPAGRPAHRRRAHRPDQRVDRRSRSWASRSRRSACSSPRSRRSATRPWLPE